jgi:hypothetical protein
VGGTVGKQTSHSVDESDIVAPMLDCSTDSVYMKIVCFPRRAS